MDAPERSARSGLFKRRGIYVPHITTKFTHDAEVNIHEIPNYSNTQKAVDLAIINNFGHNTQGEMDAIEDKSDPQMTVRPLIISQYIDNKQNVNAHLAGYLDSEIPTHEIPQQRFAYSMHDHNKQSEKDSMATRLSAQQKEIGLGIKLPRRNSKETGLGIRNLRGQNLEEVSRWSDSSEDPELSSGSDCNDIEPKKNYALDSKYNSIAESMNRSIFAESQKEKLERWKLYFDNQPLMRCLDTDDEQLLQNLMYERLLKEVSTALMETDPESAEYRGEVKIREFWDGVRGALRDGDDSPVDAIKEIKSNFKDIKSPPTPLEATDGRDAELVELRDFLMKKAGHQKG